MRYCERCGSSYQWMRTCPRDGHAPRADIVDPLLGAVIGDRYRVLERIGAGGMGQVYRAAHVRIATLFAVKVLYGDLAHDAEMRTRFAREAEAASCLQSRHIVRVVDFGETPAGLLYLVMEHLDGISLADRLARDGALAPADAVAIARQIARGVAHAHERGVVHRDLKTDNTMLVVEDDERDVVKLLDFGLARMNDRARLTRGGQVFGTPYYMAPEQFAGGETDARTDLYALGVILYEMLAGALPFDAEALGELARLHATVAPPPLRARNPAADVPPALEAVVMRLLAKSPAARFPSARALLEALRELGGVADAAVRPAASAAAAATVAAVAPEACALISAAIQRGAPAYNAGDHAGCYAIYRGTAEELLAGVLRSDAAPAAAARLRAALRRAAAADEPTAAAWEMRYGFDDLLGAGWVPEAQGAVAAEVARAEAIAAPRYAAGDLDAVGDFFLDFAGLLAARLGREVPGAGVLAMLESARDEAARLGGGRAGLPVLGRALEAVRAGELRTLAPSPRASSQLGRGCSLLPEVAQRIVQAIAVGAPTYNAGDHAGCCRVYRQAAEALVARLERDAGSADLAAHLRGALNRAATLDPTAAAWTLRHAFDAVLAAAD